MPESQHSENLDPATCSPSGPSILPPERQHLRTRRVTADSYNAELLVEAPSEEAAEIPPEQIPPAAEEDAPQVSSTNGETEAVADISVAQTARSDVGFKRPPKEHQFKPGVSGNPRGRPKGSRSLSSLVDEALSETILVKVRGRSVRMTNRAVMVKQLVDRALKGDHKAILVLSKIDPRARLDAVEDEAPVALTVEEQALFFEHLKQKQQDAQ